MRWTPGRQSSDLEDRRGSRFGGGMRLGLGGMVILLILSVVFKRDFFSLLGDAGTGSPVTTNQVSPQAGDEASQFMSFTLDDIQSTWERIFQQLGRSYSHATLVLYTDAWPSSCGTAQTAAGPFYCPGDEKVYIDLGFYDELRERFGAPGDFAQAYVLAHEIGHHVQDELGEEQAMRSAQRQRPGQANQLSVAFELQADCYAGVWGHWAGERGILEQGDLEEGIRAAAAVGDDRIQRMSGQRVNPDGFTHGTAAQRAEWFRRGYAAGQPADCDTSGGNP